ncbi:phenylacetate-CoA oxygenase subunit PaaJ [Reichenbachiella carrageenanivorans]|uniref:Phenylacetate-CoA oxygenase subunit PaaJ n=1 Tax=Reichenbachiella carrageenanivorans TaxID=2979869 RepID=A0ABY6D4S9_9BACT|nr:1,2-phenylacetyl-CoA epoxidase subunit PaaD [Reichenbachiella carrageenanivorans]UXX78860.1 phenylacetate-CoA oxygenase subunit PaaJ [Reichenbachiella carrageenanivorans]
MKTISPTVILNLLRTVMDPEIPVLSVVDMGVIRHIDVTDYVTVTITPTYSGCPAMNSIEADIKKCLIDNGYEKITVKTVLQPAWTTDWLTEHGRKQLLAYGIAPPQGSTSKRALFLEEETVPCPQCQSKNTVLVSEFGSTACKALYKCLDCLEPFDYFKCI